MNRRSTRERRPGPAAALRRALAAAVRRNAAALLLAAAAWLPSACTTTEVQDASAADYVVMAGLRLENPGAQPADKLREEVERLAKAPQTALRVLARMDAAAREKLTAPYAATLTEGATDADRRVVLQMKLNVMPPKVGDRYLLVFAHPDGATALLAARLYAEEISASFNENTARADGASPPPTPAPVLSPLEPARLISIPAPPPPPKP